MPAMADQVEATCPCCGTRLVVDARSGEILGEERPKPDHGKTFEQALGDVQGGAARREDAFSKAFDKTRRLDDLLSKKFEQARKKAAKEPGGKPRGRFDLD
jgi:hypothetical protein